VLVREKDNIWIVRDIDPDYRNALAKAKRQRHERRRRKEQRDRGRDFEGKTTTLKPLSPLVAKIRPHLPYRGKISEFPVPVSRPQLAAVCKSKRVAMIGRNDDIWIVDETDPDYDTVRSLAKDRRAWDGPAWCIDREERKELWDAYLNEFPHPH
jgi:hypothetical protein